VSLLRRKNGPDNGTSGDPTIDFARRVLQNPKGNRGTGENGNDERHTVLPPPSAVDSTFCYGEESNPCA